MYRNASKWDAYAPKIFSSREINLRIHDFFNNNLKFKLNCLLETNEIQMENNILDDKVMYFGFFIWHCAICDK